jgi:hypothetical protein
VTAFVIFQVLNEQGDVVDARLPEQAWHALVLAAKQARARAREDARARYEGRPRISICPRCGSIQPITAHGTWWPHQPCVASGRPVLFALASLASRLALPVGEST